MFHQNQEHHFREQGMDDPLKDLRMYLSKATIEKVSQIKRGPLNEMIQNAILIINEYDDMGLDYEDNDHFDSVEQLLRDVVF